MQELRLVAVSEDGTYLVLATAGRGTRFTLPIDDRLRAAIRGNFSRLGQYEIEVESPLRPKEIQARIRAGETADEIAETAGIPIDRVRWFEGPVLQEREYMAEQARRVAVRRQGESSPGPPLGDIVEERLGEWDADLDETRWDSWKRDNGTWRIRLSYLADGRPFAAEWAYDPRRRHVSPLDEEAARLSSLELDESIADTVGDRVDVWASGDDAAAALDRSVLRSSAVPGRRLPVDQSVLSRYRALAEVGAGAGPPSWTVVRAAACQTPVIVEEQGLARIPEGLRDAVTVAADADAVKLDVVARLWQDELRDREGVRLGRAVRAGHTFANAMDVLADAGGVDVPQRPTSVSAVVPTNRQHELDNVFGNIARQAHAADGGVELVLVLHGMDVSEADVKARAADAGVDSLTVLHADSSLPLGGCMNLGIDASCGDFIAKMDDDNYYGRHYLTDLVAAFDSTGAGIVGKWAHYVWLRSMDAVVLRNPKAEHRFERLVQGGSIVLTADVARQLRFGDDLPRGVDTDILNRAKEAGIGTYSADRFNYVSIRGTDRHAHTWAIADTALLNRAGTLAFYGDPREHVEV